MEIKTKYLSKRDIDLILVWKGLNASPLAQIPQFGSPIIRATNNERGTFLCRATGVNKGGMVLHFLDLEGKGMILKDMKLTFVL